MKVLTITSAVLITLAGAAPAFAQSTLTRDQVRAEVLQANRNGGISRNSDYDVTPNDLVKSGAKTRAEVKAELAEAIRTGDVYASRDGDILLNELFPDVYGPEIQASQLTRAQVKAELAEAIRTGSLVRAPEGV